MRFAIRRTTTAWLVCLVFSTSFFLPANANDRPSGSLIQTAVGQVGLRTTEFNTPQGKVRVYLPDDIRAGDTISGTVVAEPVGGSGSLDGFVIAVEGNKTSRVNSGSLKFTVPSAGAIAMTLMNSAGTEVRRTVVPIKPAISPPSNFNLPTLGQTARPVAIGGPFDGDASNTRCSIGGQAVPIVAETPREAILYTPTNVVGPSEIVLSEHGQTFKRSFRNVGVQLTAPKTNLMRGENTTLTVQVSGLQGIQKDVPMSLDCTGVVNMEGGNAQLIKLRPGDVQADGTVSLTRTLTSVQTGNFNVTATVAVPISNLSGATIHVEAAPNGGSGVWQVKVKMPNGEIVNIYIRTEQKPDLKFCDWIEINDVTSENGTLYVGSYRKVPDPTKPPVKPPDKPKPPETNKPPETTTKPPDTTPQPPPCTEGATRNISSETKTFEVMDPAGQPIFKLYTDKDGAGDAAKNMADFWRDIAEAGGLLDYLPEGTGAGAAAAGWLFEYLDKGADILDALAKGRLKNTGVSKVTAEVIISTKKITATCTTYEICIVGKWVKKKKLEQTEERSIFRAHKTATKGDDEWDKVSVPSQPQFFDPERAEAWARDFFKDQANILKGSGEGYADFVKNCK